MTHHDIAQHSHNMVRYVHGRFFLMQPGAWSCLTSGTFRLHKRRCGRTHDTNRARRGMTRNPDAFPDPETFVPERHLKAADGGKDLPSSFVFGFGRR